MDYSAAALVQALNGLQQDAARRSEYNQWLQKFQRSFEAWTVAAQVLASPGDQALHIFCAQTLRNKIKHDLYQIPESDRLGLKDNLLNLIEFNGQIYAVCVQLCVALASLALQVPEWNNPLEEMVSKLSEGYLTPLMEFLKVLPEEYGTGQLSSFKNFESRINRARELVGGNASNVLSFLVSKAQFLGKHKTLFFETLLPWISEVPVLQIVKSPLLDWVFEALPSPETIEAATECLCSIIYETDEFREPEIQQAISELYPRIMNLRSAASQYESEPELHRCMTLVFSRAAESWHTLICESPDQFSGLLDAVVECITVRDADLEVLEYTFNFLDKFQLTVDTRRFEHLRPQFAPAFQVLFLEFTKFCQYPEHKWQNSQEEDKFKEFRYDIGDMLKICCYMITPDDALKLCYQHLNNLLGPHAPETISGSWQAIESWLFCVRMLARMVPSDNDALPDIFRLFPRLPDVERVYHSALLILGRYSDWSSKHPEYREFEIDYIIKGILNRSTDVRRAAAHAFLYFFTDGAPQLVEYSSQVVNFYNSIEHLDLDSMNKVADGVANVIKQLSAEQQAQALEKIFAPIMQSTVLPLNVEQQNILGEKVNALSRFCSVLRTSGCPDDASPITLLIKHYHESLMKFLALYGRNIKVAEGVARYYISSIHNVAGAIRPLIPSLLQVTSEFRSQMYPFDFELYGSMAQIYNDKSYSLTDVELISMIWNYGEAEISAFLHVLKNSKLAEVNEELLECAFHCISDFASYYTTQFIFSDDFDGTVKAAVSALELSEISVLSSITSFFDDLNSLCTEEDVVSSRISSIMSTHGERLIYFILYGYMMNYEESFFPRADRIVAFVARVCPAKIVDWVQIALNSLSFDSVNEEEQLQTVQLIYAMVGAGDTQNIGMCLRAYAKNYVERTMAPR